MFEPEQLYFITNRTLQGRFFMTPSPRIRDLIGGILGRSLALFDVQLFGFVFMSNHFHMILRAEGEELAKFMSHLQSNIAREIGAKIDWPGKFWQRRYSAEVILDQESFVDKLGYIFSHGVKEGLVEKSQQWPGLTCIPEVTHGITRLFPWIDRSQIYRAKAKGIKISEEQATTRYGIKISVPSFWQHMSRDMIHKNALKILRNWEQKAQQDKPSQNVVGAAQVKAQHPHHRPHQSKHSHEPLCHAASIALRRSYQEKYHIFVRAYRRASLLFRRGQFDTEFPRFSFRPPPRVFSS